MCSYYQPAPLPQQVWCPSRIISLCHYSFVKQFSVSVIKRLMILLSQFDIASPNIEYAVPGCKQNHGAHWADKSANSQDAYQLGGGLNQSGQVRQIAQDAGIAQSLPESTMWGTLENNFAGSGTLSHSTAKRDLAFPVKCSSPHASHLACLTAYPLSKQHNSCLKLISARWGTWWNWLNPIKSHSVYVIFFTPAPEKKSISNLPCLKKKPNANIDFV